VEVGDLVELGHRVTRKGRPEENQVGLVVEIHADNDHRAKAIVNFCGVLCTYPVTYLRVVGEN